MESERKNGMADTAVQTKKKKGYSFREYFFYDFMKWVCFWPIVLYLRPKYIYRTQKGKERIKGPGVLLYNHSSFLDVLYIQLSVWYRRHRIVSEREQLGHGKNRLFLKLLLSLPIDRDSVSPASVRAIVKPLREGHLIDIFPEGYLNKDPDTLLPFHSGTVLFAKLGSAPLIPIYMDRGKKFWNRLHFIIGEPLSLTDPDVRCEGKEDFPRVTTLLEEKMADLQAYARSFRKPGKETK